MTAYKPYKGNYRLNAGYRYSNGTLHAAWDIGMPIGTPLYAPRDGIVLDCNDGVKNDGPNSPDYTNEPSNWILLGIEMNGQKYGFYSQHMSPGLKVRKGEHVVAGQLLGYSGDSGNSSGPHWHNAVQKTWSLKSKVMLVTSSTGSFLITIVSTLETTRYLESLWMENSTLVINWNSLKNMLVYHQSMLLMADLIQLMTSWSPSEV